MHANRQLSQDVLRGQPALDEQAELVNQPVNPEQLPVPHQEIPVPPPLPPPQEQQVPVEATESRAFIILPHYKRAANTSRHCIFGGCANQSGHLIPLLIKVMLLKQYHLYVPIHSRVCETHLYSNEWSLLNNNNNLTSRFTPQQIEDLIRVMERNADLMDFENVDEMPNHICHYWTGLNVLEFLALYDEIPVLRNVSNGKTCLAIYLTKLRTGDSDNRLSTLYNMPRSTLESYLKKMRNYFINHFVPNHVGLQHTTREEVAQRNLLIPNNLFGSPNISIEQMPAIAICDGTYIFIQKSSNYLYQKRTYSLHKYDNLIKPFLIVACDGYIIDVSGPYAATQTDSEIMRHLFENENGPMRSFFRSNDIFILDRGFRDCIPFLESYGYKVFKPESVDEGATQLTTLQANKSRCVTLCRWVVEVVNGRFKRDFKLFRQDFFNRASLHLMDDFRIAAALINRFHPLIHDRPDAQQIISRALRFLNEPNHLARFVQEFNLNRRRTMFSRIDGNLPQLQQFPILTYSELILIALGPYQVKQARSYYGEHMRENGLYLIEVCPEVEHSHEMVLQIGGNYPFLIRGRIKSRHIGQRYYFTYILVDREPNSSCAIDSILGYCCNCIVGNRTVGCCCHVMTIIWYLGWARHQENIDQPAAFLDNVLITFED